MRPIVSFFVRFVCTDLRNTAVIRIARIYNKRMRGRRNDDVEGEKREERKEGGRAEGEEREEVLLGRL